MKRWYQAIVPAFLSLSLVYCTYVLCHAVGYRIFYTSVLRPAAIVLWVLTALLTPLIYLYWAVILIRGPGKPPAVDFFLEANAVLAPPEAFLCDILGFPLYCSQCQQLKPERTFHLHFVDRCVPRFDHQCLWLCAVIGRDNLVPFFSLVKLIAVFSALGITYVGLSFKHATDDSTLMPHLVVTMVLLSFAAFMLFGLVVTSTFQMALAQTTLDALAIRQARAHDRRERQKDRSGFLASALFPKPRRFETGVRYVNVKDGNSRAVVAYNLRENPYSFGYRQNFIDALLYFNRAAGIPMEERLSRALLLKSVANFKLVYVDLFYWQRPTHDACLTYESWSDEFSPSFLASIRSKISKGEYLRPGYLLHESTLENTKTEDTMAE